MYECTHQLKLQILIYLSILPGLDLFAVRYNFELLSQLTSSYYLRL